LIELIVCAPFAARQAKQRGIPFKQELARYVIHGSLHCAGYDDHTDKQRAVMWEQQERVLRALFGKAYRETS
jgi:probable rRNA maturation factor